MFNRHRMVLQKRARVHVQDYQQLYKIQLLDALFHFLFFTKKNKCFVSFQKKKLISDDFSTWNASTIYLIEGKKPIAQHKHS